MIDEVLGAALRLIEWLFVLFNETRRQNAIGGSLSPMTDVALLSLSRRRSRSLSLYYTDSVALRSSVRLRHWHRTILVRWLDVREF